LPGRIGDNSLKTKDIWQPDQDSKEAYSNYKSRALPLQPTSSVTLLYFKKRSYAQTINMYAANPFLPPTFNSSYHFVKRMGSTNVIQITNHFFRLFKMQAS